MVVRNLSEPEAAPSAAQAGGSTSRTAILWLVALSVAIVLVPLYLAAQRLDEDNMRFSADVVSMQTSSAELSTPGAGLEELNATMTQVQAQIDALDPIYANLSGSHIDWPTTIAIVGAYDAAHLEVTGLSQSDNRLVISGRADTEAAVMAYAEMLEDSGQFVRVVVQAITVHATPTPTSTSTSTPTPVPTSTPQPTEAASGGGGGGGGGGSSGGAQPTNPPELTRTPNPTEIPAPTKTPVPTSTVPAPTATLAPTVSPTPDYRDGYEPDDVTPGLIALGETQTRNFFPLGDVDMADLIVKAGRAYLVATSNLALGVDTLLAVDLNGLHWENDDIQPPGSGDFSSAVCFAAPDDGTARITISNLAQQYTAARIYKIDVVEVPGLTVSQATLSFGPVIQGAANPPSQAIALGGANGLAWSATSDSGWLTVSAPQGMIPATLAVWADASGLAAGAYAGTLSLTWGTLCEQTIQVTLQVDPPASGEHSSGFHARPMHQSTSRDAAAVLPPDVPVEFTILVEIKVEQP